MTAKSMLSKRPVLVFLLALFFLLELFSSHIYRTTVALEVLLSRGGGAKMCVTIPTSGGLSPQTPLLVIATHVMRTMRFKSFGDSLVNSSFPVVNITHSRQIDICKRVNRL